jgi:hypothetical protein
VSALEPGDRTRLLAAGVVTIAALPFLLGGGGKAASTGVAAIGEGANLAGALDSSVSVAPPAVAATDDRAVETPGFLFGPPPGTEPSEVEVAVPMSRPGNVSEGTATYERYVTDRFGTTDPCAFTGPPIGVRLHVMDLDNGRSVWCTTIGPTQPGARADLVLDTELFAQIADLGQSPVHVRITW